MADRISAQTPAVLPKCGKANQGRTGYGITEAMHVPIMFQLEPCAKIETCT